MGNCKGVPLAIKTIGGLLLSKNYSSQNLEQEWVKFRDIELAKVDYQNETDILPTLKSKLQYSPIALETVFGLFPEDHRIDVRKLILLWIAQGFYY